MIIYNYKGISPLLCTYNGIQHLAIRSYDTIASKYFLLVNTTTLYTCIAKIAECKVRKSDNVGRYFDFADIYNSKYHNIINQYNVIEGNKKENQGLKNINSTTNGAFITIDMCPSINRLEKDLFLPLRKKATIDKVHIAIAISGLWILQHQEEFHWLQSLKSNNFAITWVNHSFSHRYYKDIDMEKNFLLLADTNIESEILDTEKILLENGEIPSIFFRFPGLISNKNTVDMLIKYGLVQLGANTWISKMNQEDKVNSGDIILIHGNGNEEKAALTRFYEFLSANNYKYLSLNNELSKINID